jgi:hypothetical protein
MLTGCRLSEKKFLQLAAGVAAVPTVARIAKRQACGTCRIPVIVIQRHLANGLASFRAQSIKRCDTELMVRFFKVTMPMGPGWIGISTGTAFNPSRLRLNCSVEAFAYPGLPWVSRSAGQPVSRADHSTAPHELLRYSFNQLGTINEAMDFSQRNA